MGRDATTMGVNYEEASATPDEGLLEVTKIVAMTIRNNLEAIHGPSPLTEGDGRKCDSLTDEQMAQINPLVRNAVVSALHALVEAGWMTINLDAKMTSPQAYSYLMFQRLLVPGYWEEPEMTDDYKETRDRTDEDAWKSIKGLMKMKGWME